jgi:succinate dehydrogenase/fumarate reductase flavoprotein subunit
LSSAWDVVVVGYGYAGGVAAIEAHDAGARVLLLEKMPDPGGISICSAGGVRVAFDANEAFAYLKETNADTAPELVLRALAEGMVALPKYLEKLARAADARVEIRKARGNYPFRGGTAFGFATIATEENEVSYPYVKGSPAGARLFQVVEENVKRRDIDVRFGARARRLLRSPGGVVEGVELDTGEKLSAFRGVVLATGGFEADEEMKKQFWQGKPVLSAAFRGNTGDGIRMAQDVGSALWHMWHYHGSYGFRHPDPGYPFGIRTKRVPDWIPDDGPSGAVPVPWILLDREGRRFMNEYEPYLQDTGHRPFERFHPETQTYPRIPAWLVADEEGRARYPFGRPTYNERGLSFDWSLDNLHEVELGILHRAEDVSTLAAGLSVSEERLQETLARWNDACARGRDVEHGRPPESLMPIRTPPYYYAAMWPIVSNTQGGPVRDERQRVVDVFGEPIPGLYSAGEIGSVFGHLYISGGNLAECFAGGRIAGREAARV